MMMKEKILLTPELAEEFLKNNLREKHLMHVQ